MMMKYFLRDLMLSFNNNIKSILIGIIIILIILIVIISMEVNKRIKAKGENSIGYTKEEVLDVILEDRKDVKKYNDLFEGYDAINKTVTIENKNSKELNEIFKVIDFSSYMYEGNLNSINLLIKILECLAVIIFGIYYVLVLWDYLIIVFISFVLVMLSLMLRYRIYRKGIHIKQNIILKKFNFNDKEEKLFLKGGYDLQVILKLLKFITFALTISLMYNYFIS